MRVLSLFMLFAGFAVGLLLVGSQVDLRQVSESVRPVGEVDPHTSSALERTLVDESDLASTGSARNAVDHSEQRPIIRAQ